MAPSLDERDFGLRLSLAVRHPTNAIDSINARPRKIIMARVRFPSDDAASKLIWLALRNITADWRRAAKAERERRTHSDCLRGPIHESSRVICSTNLPTASVVRRKRRWPPWTSLRVPRTQPPQRRTGRL